MKKKLGLDIGHGINTYNPPNSLSKGYKGFAEFTHNNAVAKFAKTLAELNGFEVYLPQPFDGLDVDIDTRCKNIKAYKCNLVISAHANAAKDETATGREVWYWTGDSKAERLAKIWDNNAIELGNKNRGIKASAPNSPYNFGILRTNSYNGIPAIITEAGFFTNDDERLLLASVDFQKLCAKVIVKTACDYFGMPFKDKVEVIMTSNPIKEVPKVVVNQEVSAFAKDAQKWVSDPNNKISDGTRPKDNVTREEMWTMLYRANQLKK